MAQPQGNMHKFPSISSIHSMASLGYLPPGHGYIPKKPKPDKPYGPSFVTVMNRSWRGPGRKYLRRYALGCLCTAIIFYTSAALYFGHRNVFRLIVRHSEPMGSILLMIAILFTGGMFYYVWKANLESNRWRSHVRFRGQGLYTAAAYNHHYVPEDEQKLLSGTYGPRAVKEIPKPKGRGRSRAGSRGSMRPVQPRVAELRGGPGRPQAPAMSTVQEDVEIPDPGVPDLQAPTPDPFTGHRSRSRDNLDDLNAIPEKGSTPSSSSDLPKVHPTRPRIQSPASVSSYAHEPPMSQAISPVLQDVPSPRYGTPPPRDAAAPRYDTPPPREAAGARYDTPPPREAPGQRYDTPPPREMPGQRYGSPAPRDPPGQRYGSPAPRDPPGQRYGSPAPRDAPGQSRYGSPPPRDAPGQRYDTPPPREVPGGRYGTPPPRDAPAARYGTPPPRAAPNAR